MSKLLIKGGRLLCPFTGKDERKDLLIEGGRIARIASALEAEDAELIDASGMCVAPGFLDLHAHLREPGREDEETISSGRRAALRGGFTALCCMPNTEPPIDCPSVVEEIIHKAERGEGADVFPIGAITRGRQGRVLAELGSMYDSSGRVRAFSDDGDGLQSAELMRRALEYVKLFDGLIISHCEDRSLAGDGLIHEGARSFRLGLRGHPSLAEEVMVARDLLLAEYTGSRLHLAHLSSARSVEMVREAKRRGLRVTAEVTPHHLFFTDDDVDGLDTNFKVNPPLRSGADREALRRGLVEGVIDAIATDHAPHSREEKEREFEYAPAGVIGLETAFSACCTALVHSGLMDISQLVEKLTLGPALVMGFKPEEYGEGIRQGAKADLVVFDPHAEVTVDPSKFASLSRNTPFAGLKLRGKVCYVVKQGKLVERIPSRDLSRKKS